MSVLYVVRGAQAQCTAGNKTTKLNLPESHGLYVNDKPVLIDTDTVANVNVMPFGECRNIRTSCKLALAPCWQETQKDALIKGRPALLTKSMLSCALGGMILIKTDGQN